MLRMSARRPRAGSDNLRGRRRLRLCNDLFIYRLHALTTKGFDQKQGTVDQRQATVFLQRRDSVRNKRLRRPPRIPPACSLRATKAGCDWKACNLSALSSLQRKNMITNPQYTLLSAPRWAPAGTGGGAGAGCAELGLKRGKTQAGRTPATGSAAWRRRRGAGTARAAQMWACPRCGCHRCRLRCRCPDLGSRVAGRSPGSPRW